MNASEPPREQQHVDMPSPTDEALLELVTARNLDAFSRLFDRYARPVHALAAHLLGATEAEEIVQETFWRVWHRAYQFDPAKGSARTWIFTIARHLVFDALKRRTVEQRMVALGEIDKLLADVPAAKADVETLSGDHQRAEAIQSALHKLPDEQRHVIVLAYFGGLSQSAIASHLGWPLGTVKKRVRLALQKLRTHLHQWNEIG